MQIKQITSVGFEGEQGCSHAFMTNGIGKLNIAPLVKSVLRNKWRKNHDLHTVERICFRCMRLEEVVTQVDYSTPFTFSAVLSQLKEKVK
jgi:hypothetical protein